MTRSPPGARGTQIASASVWCFVSWLRRQRRPGSRPAASPAAAPPAAAPPALGPVTSAAHPYVLVVPWPEAQVSRPSRVWPAREGLHGRQLKAFSDKTRADPHARLYVGHGGAAQRPRSPVSATFIRARSRGGHPRRLAGGSGPAPRSQPKELPPRACRPARPVMAIMRGKQP